MRKWEDFGFVIGIKDEIELSPSICAISEITLKFEKSRKQQ